MSRAIRPVGHEDHLSLVEHLDELRTRIIICLVTVGVAFERKNGEEGLSVKLNTLPVGQWDGTLILLPPLVAEGDVPTEE